MYFKIYNIYKKNVKMNVHSVSLIGKRESNEDQHVVFLNGDSKNDKYCPVNFFSIFDGHGGGKISKFLKQNLQNYFTNKKVSYPLHKGYINMVFDYMQYIMQKQHYNTAFHSGSTCLTAIHYRKNGSMYLQVINLGDCRAVICRDNLGIPLTKDHKPNWPEEKERIEKLNGEKIHFDGEDWRIKDLSVSRAFGDIEAKPYLSHRPDIFRYKLDKTDKFVVLACDGLWDVLSSQDAINFVLECQKEDDKKKKKNIAQVLAEHAIAKGSMDNITVIIIFFKN